MEKTIRVTGKGTAKATPDTVVLSLKTEGTCKEYDLIVKLASMELEQIKRALEKHGFKKEDLKTVDFDIYPRNESQKDKKGNYKSVFVGYAYERKMKLSFPKDNARLGKVMVALAHCGADPSISINYTISDTESLKNQILEKAIMDARQKAVALCRGAEVELGEIVNIDYSFGTVYFETAPIEMSPVMCASIDCEPDFDIEPEDISSSDNVTVIYRIK